MMWIVNPEKFGYKNLECWIDICGNFCLIQNCPGQECSTHVCFVYLHSSDDSIDKFKIMEE